MAIQNLKCPNCGGEVQLDDNLEKGFCMYCGGAIQIKEEVAKIKVEHSGKIEIDDSKKLANSLALADRAFEAGNYEECYNYCCNVLECDINNAQIIFRKGLCAAYISLTRTNELGQAVKTAIDIIKNTSDNVDNDVYVIFSELLKYIKSAYSLNCNRAKGFSYPDLIAANNTFTVVSILTELCGQCSDLISEDMMSTHPTYESDKRVCLELGLDLCKIGVSSLKYFDGYRQVKKGDRYVNEEVYKKAKSPYIDMQRSYMDKFKDAFNNLPTTRKALMEYNGEIENLQKDIDAFNNKLEEYFKANPEIEKEYKKRALPFVIGTGASFFLIIFLAATITNTDSGIFGFMMFLSTSSFLTLGVLSIVKAIKYSKNRKKILNELPAELACLKNVHDQSKIKLQSVTQAKAAFEKKNVKR